jgi:hypothetical protein
MNPLIKFTSHIKLEAGADMIDGKNQDSEPS